MVAFVTVVITAACAFFRLLIMYLLTTTRRAAVMILSIKHIIQFMLTIDFRLEPRLFSEAAGLAFVNGAGQWDIWQPLLVGGGVSRALS